MQGGRGEDGAERDPAIGRVDMELVAAPGLQDAAGVPLRAPSKRDVDREALRESWQRQAEGLGFDARELVADARSREADNEAGPEPAAGSDAGSGVVPVAGAAVELQARRRRCVPPPLQAPRRGQGRRDPRCRRRPPDADSEAATGERIAALEADKAKGRDVSGRPKERIFADVQRPVIYQMLSWAPGVRKDPLAMLKRVCAAHIRCSEAADAAIIDRSVDRADTGKVR